MSQKKVYRVALMGPFSTIGNKKHNPEWGTSKDVKVTPYWVVRIHDESGVGDEKYYSESMAKARYDSLPDLPNRY